MPLKEARYREKILLYLARNLSNNVTGNKIATDLNLFYSLVHKTIKDLEKDGLLKIEKIGNYKLLKLSLDKHRTLLELALLSHKHAEQSNIDQKTKDFIDKISNDKDVLSAIMHENNIIVIANKISIHLEIASKTSDMEVSIIKHDDLAEKLSDNEFSNNLLNGVILHGYENFWRMMAESRS